MGARAGRGRVSAVSEHHGRACRSVPRIPVDKPASGGDEAVEARKDPHSEPAALGSPKQRSTYPPAGAATLIPCTGTSDRLASVTAVRRPRARELDVSPYGISQPS